MLELRRSEGDGWAIDAEEVGAPDLPASGGDPVRWPGPRDCDLGLSPVTNLMPTLRHGVKDRATASCYRVCLTSLGTALGR
jgi:hypothetical protein